MHGSTAKRGDQSANVILRRKMESGSFDVFLCHNHRDKPKIKAIGEELKAQGVLPWLDEWELRPGLPWQRALEQQIENVQSAALFVGAEGIGPWQHQELDAFLSFSEGILAITFECSVKGRSRKHRGLAQSSGHFLPDRLFPGGRHADQLEGSALL